MSLFRSIFPEKSRTFSGQRWTKISLRTVHLLGVAGMGGGFLYSSPEQFWKPYLIATLISGIAFMLQEIWSNGVWLIQVRGIAVFLKLILLSFLLFSSGFEVIIIFSVIIISGVISHAPGELRYFSVFHGRRIEAL
ncbi:MAG: hypothetical protein IME96_11705 [Proteobacteria bacterium]|nr:hypothetical protein [Pseudomonadota bacterium]